jgi:tartrate dehydrogenase/decarboxylase/D-malate dehydrogenase
MKSFRIALYPGDGIGPEVMTQAVRVLELAQKLDGGFRLELTRFPWSVDYYFQHGHAAPDDLLDQLRGFDAVLLGAVGDPRRLPDHVTLGGLIRMRQGFDQYVCLRPCRLCSGVSSLLRAPHPIDLVIVRENSEGEYVMCGGRVRKGQPEEVAVQSAVHTRRGVERILRFGFQLAKTRRRRLTMVTKSNALGYSMVLWDEVLEAVRAEFPNIETDRQHADAAAMNFVRCPDRFDVVVASNLFGDILSDLGGAIIGGLGLAPSANINPERTAPSMFEPVHGSAPDIAGKGIANPVAMILSSAMMLDWLGLESAAKAVRQATDAALAGGAKTPDLGGTLTTGEMTEQILKHLQSAK